MGSLPTPCFREDPRPHQQLFDATANGGLFRGLGFTVSGARQDENYWQKITKGPSPLPDYLPDYSGSRLAKSDDGRAGDE